MIARTLEIVVVASFAATIVEDTALGHGVRGPAATPAGLSVTAW
jgi:hypothetical protein